MLFCSNTKPHRERVVAGSESSEWQVRSTDLSNARSSACTASLPHAALQASEPSHLKGSGGLLLPSDRQS